MFKRKTIVTREPYMGEKDYWKDVLYKQRVFSMPSVYVPGALIQKIAFKGQTIDPMNKVDTSPISNTSMELAGLAKRDTTVVKPGMGAGAYSQALGSEKGTLMQRGAEAGGYKDLAIAAEPATNKGVQALTSEQVAGNAMAGPPTEGELLSAEENATRSTKQKEDFWTSPEFKSSMGLIASSFAQTPGQQQAGKMLLDQAYAETNKSAERKAKINALRDAGINVSDDADPETIKDLIKEHRENRKVDNEEKAIDAQVKVHEQQILQMKSNMKLTDAQEQKIRQDIAADTPMVVDMPDGRSVSMRPLDYYNLQSKIALEARHAEALAADAKLKGIEAAQLQDTTTFMGVSGVPKIKVAGYMAELEGHKIAERTAIAVAITQGATARDTTAMHIAGQKEVAQIAQSGEKDSVKALGEYRKALVGETELVTKSINLRTKEGKLTPAGKDFYESQAVIAAALYNSPHATEADKALASNTMSRYVSSGFIKKDQAELLLKQGATQTPPPAVSGYTNYLNPSQYKSNKKYFSNF